MIFNSIFWKCVGGTSFAKEAFWGIKSCCPIKRTSRGSFWAIQVISRLPPTDCTHFIGVKQPSKVKFQPALECVGVDLELRSKKFPSILDPDKCVEINCIVLTCKLTPTEVKNFLARFSTFRNFFKNVLGYQNCSKFARGPNSTYSSIWVNWGSEKVGNSLFSGPFSKFVIVFREVRN